MTAHDLLAGALLRDRCGAERVRAAQAHWREVHVPRRVLLERVQVGWGVLRARPGLRELTPGDDGASPQRRDGGATRQACPAVAGRAVRKPGTAEATNASSTP